MAWEWQIQNSQRNHVKSCFILINKELVLVCEK